LPIISIVGKFFDYLIITLLAVVTLYAWLRFFGIQRYVSLEIATGIVALLLIVLVLIKLKLGRSRLISYDALFFALSVVDATETVKNYAATIPGERLIKVENPFILAEVNGVKTAYMIAFKFYDILPDDVAKAYRFSIKNRAERVVIFGRGIGKNTRQTAVRLNLIVDFPTKKEIRKYFVKHNIVPVLDVAKNNKVKFGCFREFMDSLTDERRIKYYLLSGTTLLLTSFFTNLKIYYLVMAMLPVILCGACLVKKLVFR